MAGRGQRSRCSLQRSPRRDGAEAHLGLGELRAPQVGPNWLYELSVPISHQLDPTREVGNPSTPNAPSCQDGTTGAFCLAWRAAIEREGPRECDSYEHVIHSSFIRYSVRLNADVVASERRSIFASLTGYLG